jgi:hypothetical protein
MAGSKLARCWARHWVSAVGQVPHPGKILRPRVGQREALGCEEGDGGRILCS